MKRKVRVSSKSPMAREIFGTSNDTLDQTSNSRKRKASKDIQKTRSWNQQSDGSLRRTSERRTTSASSQSQHDHQEQDRACGVRTLSDLGMEKMAMGTLLPSRENLPITPTYRHFSRPVSRIQTPEPENIRDLASETPETAVKDSARSESDLLHERRERDISLDKPLPLIGSLQMAEASPPLAPQDTIFNTQLQGFVPRLSSSTESQISTCQGQTSVTSSPKKSQDHGARSSKIFEVNDMNVVGLPQTEIRPGNSVKLLARKFTEASRAMRKESSAEVTVPTVYAYVHTLSAQDVSVDDPFSPTPRTSPGRVTLIPKPVVEAGRIRNAQSRSPSPPKNESPKSSMNKPLLASPRVRGNDAKIRKEPTTHQVETPTKVEKRSSSESTQREILVSRGTADETAFDLHNKKSPRLTSVYSSESFRRSHATLGRQSTALQSIPRDSSLNRTLSPNPSETRTFALNDFNGSDSVQLSRRTSANATLYAEIQRLKRQLEQKTEEAYAAQKILDAIRDSREDGTAYDNGMKRSVSKGTLSAEVYEARRELDLWKSRAEWAERRLQGLGEPAGLVARKISEDCDNQHHQDLEGDAICGLKDSYNHAHQGSQS